jgi:hypothetical protein
VRAGRGENLADVGTFDLPLLACPACARVVTDPVPEVRSLGGSIDFLPGVPRGSTGRTCILPAWHWQQERPTDNLPLPHRGYGRCEAQPMRSASETMIPSGPRT